MAFMYYSFSWSHKNILEITGLIMHVLTNQIEDTNMFCQQFLTSYMTTAQFQFLKMFEFSRHVCYFSRGLDVINVL